MTGKGLPRGPAPGVPGPQLAGGALHQHRQADWGHRPGYGGAVRDRALGGNTGWVLVG